MPPGEKGFHSKMGTPEVSPERPRQGGNGSDTANKKGLKERAHDRQSDTKEGSPNNVELVVDET